MRQLTDLEQRLVTLSQEQQRRKRQREQEMMERLNYSDDEVAKRLQKLGYYDCRKNHNGKGIKHQYKLVERHGEKLVVDYTTGLTWQQLGSDSEMTYADAQKYVSDLNDQKFAGFSDWRMPTLEEAMALMEPEKRTVICILIQYLTLNKTGFGHQVSYLRAWCGMSSSNLAVVATTTLWTTPTSSV